VLIEGITVWDGEVDLGVSSLSWDRSIESVRPERTDRFPDLCVIPGIVDTHVHLVSYAGPGHGDYTTWPLVTTRDEQVLHGVSHAQRALRNGVTTIRDLAADEAQVAIRRAFDAQLLVGPRVRAHGVVGMTGGHNDLFTPPAVAQRKPSADGADACRRLVRTWARSGMDGIKVTTSGGVLSMVGKTSWRNYTRTEVNAIVDQAHALGMLVAAHSHVPVAPTLLINEAIAHGTVPVTAEAQDKAAALVATRDELLRHAADVGVRFVLGTDANGHHVQLGDEMAELARMSDVLGFDAPRCLRAATSDAAAAIGLGDELGRIAPGYGADLVVMRGRPWLDLRELRPENIVAVVCRGQVVHGELPTA
jgi:imidazolonepropionase-like amidohydrolase